MFVGREALGPTRLFSHLTPTFIPLKESAFFSTKKKKKIKKIKNKKLEVINIISPKPHDARKNLSIYFKIKIIDEINL